LVRSAAKIAWGSEIVKGRGVVRFADRIG